MKSTNWSAQRARKAILLLSISLACEGDPHGSAGTFQLDAAGGLAGHVEGAAGARYSERFSSTSPAFYITMDFPNDQRVFGRKDPGLFSFILDSLPTPGTYAVRSDQRGVRRLHTILVILSWNSGEENWSPTDGTVRFAPVDGSRDGLRAEFDIRFVRDRGGPGDTSLVTGALTTR